VVGDQATARYPGRSARGVVGGGGPAVAMLCEMERTMVAGLREMQEGKRD
jgi:hypothetical protein